MRKMFIQSVRRAAQKKFKKKASTNSTPSTSWSTPVIFIRWWDPCWDHKKLVNDMLHNCIYFMIAFQIKIKDFLALSPLRSACGVWS